MEDTLAFLGRSLTWIVFVTIHALPQIFLLAIGFFAAIFTQRILKKWLPTPNSWIAFAGVILTVIYQMYRGFYPNSDFYISEYRTITDDSLANDIEVIYGSATYPTFHSDYCSSALLKFTQEKHEKLLKSLAMDKTFKDSIIMGSDAYGDVLKYLNGKPEYLHKFSKRDPRNYLFIGFIPGNRALINRCFD